MYCALTISTAQNMICVMNQELAWWDKWNTEARTKTFTLECDAGRTGLLALEEVRKLKLQNPSILEVGCGTGWLAEKLSAIGPYLGIDISPAAVDAAKGRVPGAKFAVADFHDWEHTGTFDVVLMVDTIAYFRDQDLAVAHARSLINPEGWLILTTVNPFVYSRISWVGTPAPGQTRKWLTRRALFDLVARNGFETVKCYTAFPAGDSGILRVLNSRKIAKLLFGGEFPAWVVRIKEVCGLGQYRIAVVRKKSAC
jgi:2-polyprenyl-3-methyl-5-hydroxy-6-metoxy-1,4-benzoquinol methylase